MVYDRVVLTPVGLLEVVFLSPMYDRYVVCSVTDFCSLSKHDEVYLTNSHKRLPYIIAYNVEFL